MLDMLEKWWNGKQKKVLALSFGLAVRKHGVQQGQDRDSKQVLCQLLANHEVQCGSMVYRKVMHRHHTFWFELKLFWFKIRLF